MKKLLLVLLALPLLAACGTAQTNPKAAVSATDLTGKSFALNSVNGEPFSGERAPSLRFNENMRISGQICNHFNGPAQLKNSVLTVPRMASTMMLCDERLNKLERDFATLLQGGAALSLEDGVLTLSGQGINLEYRAASPEK